MLQSHTYSCRSKASKISSVWSDIVENGGMITKSYKYVGNVKCEWHSQKTPLSPSHTSGVISCVLFRRCSVQKHLFLHWIFSFRMEFVPTKRLFRKDSHILDCCLAKQPQNKRTCIRRSQTHYHERKATAAASKKALRRSLSLSLINIHI